MDTPKWRIKKSKYRANTWMLFAPGETFWNTAAGSFDVVLREFIKRIEGRH